MTTMKIITAATAASTIKMVFLNSILLFHIVLLTTTTAARTTDNIRSRISTTTNDNKSSNSIMNSDSDSDSDCNTIVDASSSSSCIDRSTTFPPIQVIVHGDTINDPFWKQVRAGMEETARTMGMKVDISMYDNNDNDNNDVIQAMVTDLRKYASDTRQHELPSAIIVSVPDATNGSSNSRIEEALHSIQEKNIPIFGINALVPTISSNTAKTNTNATVSSTSSSSASFLYGSVSMNDTHAGIVAGNYINELLEANDYKENNSNKNNHDENEDENEKRITGLYINHQADVYALQERFKALSTTTNNSITSWDVLDMTMNNVDTYNYQQLEEKLVSLFQGCTYTVIQLATGSIDQLVKVTMTALIANGCQIEDQHIIGTFDTSPVIYDAFSVGTIKFTVSQQPYSQGSYAILQAALHVFTTGTTENQQRQQQQLNNNNNVIHTGPILITSESYDNNNILVDQHQRQCEMEGYPVCNNSNEDDDEKGLSSSSCPCTDRSEMTIAVVTHNNDEDNDEFWTTIYSGMTQAALDFGVTLQQKHFVAPSWSSSSSSSSSLSQQQSQQQSSQSQSRLPNKKNHNHNQKKDISFKHNLDIDEACRQNNIDGVIVTLPDTNMLESLSECRARGIPFLVMNANSAATAAVQLHDGSIDSDDDDDDDDDDRSLASSSLSLSAFALPYIGQQEYDSGYEAGRRLIQAGVTQGWCVIHATFDTLYERCRGMEAAFLDAHNTDDTADDDTADTIKFRDIIHVPISVNNDRSDNDDIIISTYKYIVESILGKDNENKSEKDETDTKDNDWSGYGLLSTGKIQIPALLSLVTDHPTLLVGTFDTIDSALLVSYEHERQRQRRKMEMEMETNTKKTNGSTLLRNTPPLRRRRLPSSSSSSPLSFSIQEQIIFSIDQHAYIQGYLSVATLVLKLSTFGEGPTNNIVQTGPTFVEGGGGGTGTRKTRTTTTTPTTIAPPPNTKCRPEQKNHKFCTVLNPSGTSITTTTTTTTTTTNDVDGLIINPTIQENRNEPPLKYSGKCSQLGRPCAMCEGDCDDDTHCGAGLVCFVRDSKTKSQHIPVPGCSTNPEHFTAKDFCVDASVYQCQDEASFEVRVANFFLTRTCVYVQDDKRRCSEYGRYCRATCGYCRSDNWDQTETDY